MKIEVKVRDMVIVIVSIVLLTLVFMLYACRDGSYVGINIGDETLEQFELRWYYGGD